MAYIDFPDSQKGMKERKQFWLSEEGLTLIAGWRREGIPIDEIALQYLGIGSTTFWRWQKESDALEKALGMAQDVTNAKVEQALLQRALGYEVEEETWELVEGEMRKVRVNVRHVPPDVKACLSWLYSRRSDRWRSIQEPIDTTFETINTAKDILIAIKEVADGNADTTQSETD